MRGGKGEGKIAGPLFPRLHVNDAEKGGPRPPPRNKMALYEQLSIPSHRVTDRSSSMLPLPSINGGKPTNIDSSSQGHGIERSTFSPSQNFAASGHSKGRQDSCFIDGIPSKTNGNSIKRLMMTAHTGNLDAPESAFPTNPVQTCNVSQLQWPSLQKDESGLKAWSAAHPKNCSDSSKNQTSLDNERIFIGSNRPSQLRTAVVERLQTSISAEPESEGHVNVLKEGLKIYEAGQGHEKNLFDLPQPTQEHNENPTPALQARDKILPAISLKPLTEEEPSDLSNQTSSNSHRKSSDLDETSSGKACDHVDITMRLKEVPNGDVNEQPNVLAVNDMTLRSASCHESPITYLHGRTLNAVVNIHQHEEENDSNPLPANTIYKNDGGSGAAVMNSVSCPFLSPDEVVEMIGHKHFWKVRRTIMNQQRVFSMQVYELHRIIKVQKIICGSKNQLQEESLFQGKAFNKPSSVKELSPQLVTENPMSYVKSKQDFHKTKVAADNLIEKPPRTPLNNDITTISATTRQNFGSSAAVFSSLDNKLPLWGLPPARNQWLVPVMSPSEGLVYKPYTEPPCPPPGGFLPTLYGSCVPTNGATPSEELHKSLYENFPGAYTRSPMYFSPYGMPIMNPTVSKSNIEPIAAAVGDSNDFSALYQRSCIFASERKVGETLLSKDTERLESGATISKKRSSSDALQLFPTAPTDRISAQPVQTHSSEQKTRVIRVIPRNPRLASESAARIIKLIQEERKHLCN